MRVFKRTTSKRSYIAEQFDERNFVVKVDDPFGVAIGTYPVDLFEESLDWHEVDQEYNDNLKGLFQSLNPNK